MVMRGIRESQRAWVGHGPIHDDSPPRRLERAEPEFLGEPFEEEVRWFPVDDDWDYDDPDLDMPEEDMTDVFDSSRGGD
jgi:hypothetical protein